MPSSTNTDTTSGTGTTGFATNMEFLRELPVFSGSPVEVVKLFAYLAERKIYEAGSLIIEADKEAKSSYLLVTGEAEISIDHQGQEIVLQQLAPGAFFGELALLARFSWIFNAKALTDCEVIGLSRTAFRKVLSRFPERQELMIERIVQFRIKRIEEQTRSMLEYCSCSDRKEGGPPPQIF